MSSCAPRQKYQPAMALKLSKTNPHEGKDHYTATMDYYRNCWTKINE